MKIAGIILVIIGGFNVIVRLIALSNGKGDGGVFVFSIGLTIFGVYFINRGNKKKKHTIDKSNWNKDN